MGGQQSGRDQQGQQGQQDFDQQNQRPNKDDNPNR
jgi:hypothetical protein